MTTHTYATAVQWEGSTGLGYRGYSRAHAATAIPAHATLALSADAAFRGDATRLNPEQLLVVAASSCQLLSFLAVAAQHKVDVLGYTDSAKGVMDDTAEPARISRIVLRPVVTVAAGTDPLEVVRLAQLAHEGLLHRKLDLQRRATRRDGGLRMSGAFRDLSVLLADRPGSLAEFGRILGGAGVSLEGGGVFTHEGVAIAHFLVDHAERGRAALEAHGIGPVTISDVVTLRLDQDLPGQLGAFSQTVADAGISIRVQYSDHDHRLVLVVDPDRQAECLRIAAEWDAAREARHA